MIKKIFLLATVSIIAISCLTACDTTVTCPSCNKKVDELYTDELFEGSDDYRTWCADCWDDYRELSPYK